MLHGSSLPAIPYTTVGHTMTNANTPLTLRFGNNPKSDQSSGILVDEDQVTRFCLKTIIGSTIYSSAGFDSVADGFAVAAGSAVMLAHVDPELTVSQRFFSARPTIQHAPTSPSYASQAPQHTTGSRRRHVSGSKIGGYDIASVGSPQGDTQARNRSRVRQRVKPITCLSLSSDGKLLAVGEVSRTFAAETSYEMDIKHCQDTLPSR